MMKIILQKPLSQQHPKKSIRNDDSIDYKWETKEIDDRTTVSGGFNFLLEEDKERQNHDHDIPTLVKQKFISKMIGDNVTYFLPSFYSFIYFRYFTGTGKC